jgi:hypothetical protein
MIGTLEIEQMSRTEKLQAMELIGRSITAKPGKLESPKLKRAKANSSHSPSSRNVS